MFRFHCLNFLSFVNSNPSLQYLFVEHSSKVSMSRGFFYHLHLLVGKYICLLIVAPHIMVSPEILVISEIKVTSRYNLHAFNNFSCWMDDVYLWMSSIIYLLSTRWGRLIFVDCRFNWTLNCFSSLIKSVIHMLFKCSIVWLLFSRIRNDVPEICWNHKSMTMISIVFYLYAWVF